MFGKQNSTRFNSTMKTPLIRKKVTGHQRNKSNTLSAIKKMDPHQNARGRLSLRSSDERLSETSEHQPHHDSPLKYQSEERSKKRRKDYEEFNEMIMSQESIKYDRILNVMG